MKKVTCTLCGEPGHVASKCPQFLEKQKEGKQLVAQYEQQKKERAATDAAVLQWMEQ